MGGHAWLSNFVAGITAIVNEPATNAQVWLTVAGTLFLVPFAQWAAKELWMRLQRKDEGQDAALHKLAEEMHSGFERLSAQIFELHSSSKVLETEIAHLRQLRDEDREELRRAGARLDAEIGKLRDEVAAARGTVK